MFHPNINAVCQKETTVSSAWQHIARVLTLHLYMLSKKGSYTWRRILYGSLATMFFFMLTYTSSAAVRYAVTTGNWNGSIWANTVAGIPGSASSPTALDIAIINNNVTVSLTATASALSVTVGAAGPGFGTLVFNSSSNVSLTVANNITVVNGIMAVNNNSGSRMHALIAGGNISVAAGSIFNMVSNDGSDVGDVTFVKNGNATVSGAGMVNFNAINLVMGVSINNILDVTSVITMTNGKLTLISGTFKLSSASTIVPFTTTANIPVVARLWNNGGVMNSINSLDWLLAGILQVSAGVINHGVAANDRIAPSASGTGVINISGGQLNCAGRISYDSNPWTYNMSGGVLRVGLVGNNNAGYDPFNMDNANYCSFSMSGGTLIICKPGGSAGQNLGYHNTATFGTGFTGGTLQIGDGTTPPASTISIDTSIPIYNLVIASPNVTARITTYHSTIRNDVEILAGTLNSNNRNIAVGRHWTNNASFVSTGARVTFNGTVPQSLGGTNATSFNHLTINNTNPIITGATIALYNNVTVNGLLTLTRGFMVTSTSDMIYMTATSSTMGTNANSYVNGPISKAGNTAFVFPIGYGNGEKWARLGINTPSSTSTFVAQYFNLPFFNTSNLAATPMPALNNVSLKEFWQLSRTTGSGISPVTLYWEDAAWSGINECTTADLRVSVWNGAAWGNPNNTVLSTGTCIGASSGTVGTLAPLVSIGTLTFGSLLNMVNPLPVELIEFNAHKMEKEVVLNWITASELNNDYFEVQKSFDGVQFEVMEKIKGGGTNNSTLYYSTIDRKPFEGLNFYRLRQVDYNGDFEFSKIVQVDFSKSVANRFQVYPNPVSDLVYVVFNSEVSSASFYVELSDKAGRVLWNNLFHTIEKENHFSVPVNNIASGIYCLKIKSETNEVLFQSKVVVIKK